MRPVALLWLLLVVALAFNHTRFPSRHKRAAAGSSEYVLSEPRAWAWDEVAALLPRLEQVTGCVVTQAIQSTHTYIVLSCPAPLPAGLNGTILLGRIAAGLLIERNHAMHVVGGVQTSAPWHLDRLDASGPIYDGLYHYYDLGDSTVVIYHIDTGVRASHQDFGGRATAYANTVDGSGPADGNGHGTHTASLAIGIEFGVAKGSPLVAIKALDDTGTGSVASVAAAISLVQELCLADPNHPCVLTMSLSGGKSPTLDSAISSLQSSCHISIVVAAGNQADNACNYSPGDVSACLTVGASNPDDSTSYYSNVGSCVDLRAPGGDGGANPVVAAWYTSDSATAGQSGTSESTPIVAGIAAILIHQRMASGYQLGSDNVGLLTDAEILSHLRNGIAFADFDGSIQALSQPLPPPPPPPPRAPPAPPRGGAAPPSGLGQQNTGVISCIALGIIAWWMWL